MEIVTGLLSRELDAEFPLSELFGAGYEILHPFRNELRKFADISYYFWKAEEVEPGKWYLSMPFLAMNYSYHDDILIIRSVRLSPGQQANVCKIDSDELHFIKPIYRMVDDNELVGYSPSSLNSRMVCTVFLCQNSAGEKSVFSTFGRYI